MRSIFTLLFTALIHTAMAQAPIPFDHARWQITGGQQVSHLDQPALRGGRAVLSDVEFHNGVIEVDMAFSGRRGFAGINFRMRPDGQYEHFYIRPHKTGLPDALQYTPVFHGLSSWQLYSGPGYTARAVIPRDQWVHVRLELKDSQARVFLNRAETPSLVIDRLQHGDSRGQIGLFGPGRGAVHFANFSYEQTDTLHFDAPAPLDIPAGLIMNWEITTPVKLAQIDMNRCPNAAALQWTAVSADENGLLDLARHVTPVAGDASTVYARTTLQADTAFTLPLSLGYSDVVSVFLNGQPIFTGNNSFRSRDPGFLGILGRHDEIHLPLKKGNNELLMTVIETFGGWGISAQNTAFIKKHPAIKQLWQLSHTINMPESALWDARRQRLYVSNYGLRAPRGTQTVSTHGLDGSIRQIDWVSGLDRPCGMLISEGKLYVVERRSVAVIDIETAAIEKRLTIPNPGFPNDIAMDEAGRLYVTDAYRNCIFRSTGDSFEPWLDTPVNDPNGICCHDGRIVWGDNGAGALKSIDLKTQAVQTVATLGPGNLDGIQWDARGFYLVTHFSGRLYKIMPDGEKTLLLNTSAAPLNLADFCYIPQAALFVFPGLFTNRLTAFQFDDALFN